MAEKAFAIVTGIAVGVAAVPGAVPVGIAKMTKVDQGEVGVVYTMGGRCTEEKR